MEFSRTDVEGNMALARMQRDVAIETKRISIDEMSHAARWVMASVLAINSGGLIAAISKIDTLEFWGMASVASFYFGLMTALNMGWAQATMNQKLLPIHSRAISFWESAAIDGQLGDTKELEKIRDELRAQGRNGPLSGPLGKWSFWLFSLGMLFLGLSLATPDEAKVEPAAHEVSALSD